MQSSQTGISLVEVMLASALGLFLIFGFIQVYLSVEKTLHLQQAIISIQENGRFAEHFLKENIRMAGYAFCSPFDQFKNTDLAIRGYDKDLPVFLKNSVKKNTDSIEVGKCAVRDKKEKFEQFAFFISTTERQNKLGNFINALYTKYRTNSTKRELLPGIDDMQISYGVINNSADENIADYVTASKVHDWKKIRAVKIALLLSSELPVLTQPESTEFADKKLPASRFLRREWDVYVALRE